MFGTKIILQVSSINIYGWSCNANVGSNIINISKGKVDFWTPCICFLSALKWHLIYHNWSWHSNFTFKKDYVFFIIFWMFHLYQKKAQLKSFPILMCTTHTYSHLDPADEGRPLTFLILPLLPPLLNSSSVVIIMTWGLSTYPNPLWIPTWRRRSDTTTFPVSDCTPSCTDERK